MFKADDINLSDILNDVQVHDLQLPDFQRGWVWEDNRIKALLASLSLGYPIGAAMLLESGGDFHFKCRNVEGSGDEFKVPTQMILDGQQRITSMFRAMRCKDSVETTNDQKKPIKRYYYLDIERALSSTTDRVDAIISVDENKQRRENIGRDIVLDFSSPELEFKNKVIPFNIMTDLSELNEWRNKYQSYYNFDPAVMRQYQELDDKVLRNITTYKLPIIIVKKETPKEAVCQVFEHVNQGGVPLTVFELLTATFAADNFDLRKDWNDIKNRFKEKKILRKVDNTSFMTAATLLVSYEKGGVVSCKRKDVLNLTKDEYEANRERLVLGYERMYRFLTEMCLFSEDDIPYSTQFIPLSVICTVLDKEMDNYVVKEKLKRWFWCGVFGELYGAANETRYALDVPQVISWVKGNMEVPKTVNDSSFSSIRLLGLQTKNSAAYKGIMALILAEKCRDWISGTEMELQNFFAEDIDIHHIFPEDYCKKEGYDKQKWNSIVNKTPLFASTNRFIHGYAPSVYIQNIERKTKKDRSEIVPFIGGHLINCEKLFSDDFEGFIIDRAKKLLDLIEKATGKSIADRGSEETIRQFGESLINSEGQLVYM